MKTAARRDAARTDDLSGAIAQLLPALDAFLRFEGPDPAGRRSAWRATLDEPLPRTGHGEKKVLDTLSGVLIPNGLRVGHPGFSGWVTTMPTTVAAAANLASTVSAPQRWWVTPANFIDQLAISWLGELLGLPATFAGTLTGGGSTANLVGMGAARQHAAERAGIDASRDGIASLREPRVYASTQVHHVVGRALGVLGMGRRHLVNVPLDASGVCDVRELRRLLDADLKAGCTPVAIVASAGDVNTGRIDPIGEMSALAHTHGIWFHVDGAYGGFGILDERVRELYGDVSSYDSFAIDPHKWLAAPVGTGAAFVRDGAILGRAFTVEPGDYEAPRGRGTTPQDLDSPFEELGEGTPDYGVDFSTPSRGLAVWAILKEIGAEGMRDRVRRHLDCARRVAELAHSNEELEVLAEPVLSICCFRYRPKGVHADKVLDALNERIVKDVRARGRCTPSSTIVDGRFAIRPCFINARTTLDDADALVAEVLAAGRGTQLVGSGPTSLSRRP